MQFLYLVWQLVLPFLSPWLEDEAIRQGWIQAVDGQSIRADAEGPSTGASVSKLEADSASGPASTAGTAAASGSASVASTAKRLSSERPNDPAVTSESAQQIADAAFTGATTLRYRPLAVPSTRPATTRSRHDQGPQTA